MSLARRLLWGFLLVSIGLGYLTLHGKPGAFHSSVAGSLVTLSVAVASLALFWWLALAWSGSARTKAEESLRLSEALLAEAQTIAHMGSWEHDPATGAMSFSDELFRLLGWAPHAVKAGREALLERLHPEDRVTVEALLDRGGPFTASVRILRPENKVRILALRCELVTAQAGRAVRSVGVAQDVTEQWAVERMKDEFISVVSHELRTPLTAIRGALGLLATGRLGELSPRGQDMLEVAARNSDRLVRLVNDILDVERMASGATELRLGPCQADELLRQAAEAMEATARKAGVTLVVEPGTASLVADADRLLQVLTNLIDNAIKFSVEGATVRLGAEAQEGSVRFHVQDTGRGIPPEALERVFERFGQVDASDSRQKGGTGLGLTICRDIVQLHGGRIGVTSALGEGSTFTFTLPARGAG